MFAHIFKYRLKKLLKTKEMVFWTLAFPLMLAFFFNLAFANLDSNEGFDPIDVALVNNNLVTSYSFFIPVIQQVSSGDDRLFNLVIVSLEEAKTLLKEGAIKGYMVEDSSMKLYVKESGVSQNIIRLFLDNLNQTSAVVNQVMNDNPEALESVLVSLQDTKQYIKEATSTTAPPTQKLNYFYSLIAMACMYGAFFGSDEVTDIQANITDRAARINLAPIHKMKAFLASSLASYLILSINMMILLLFVRFALQIDFGDKTALVVLTTMVGTLVGMSFGSFISSLIKKGENIKVAVIVSVTMAGAFLSGMMFAQMKYIVQSNVPILAYLNPVNLITDSFYSLYYFETLDRYVFNMSILLVMACVFSVATYLVLRRRKYASI